MVCMCVLGDREEFTFIEIKISNKENVKVIKSQEKKNQQVTL